MKQDIFKQYKKAVKAQEEQEFNSQEEVWAKIENKLDGGKKRTIPIWMRYGAVASVLLLIGFLGVWQFNPLKKGVENTAFETENTDREPSKVTTPNIVDEIQTTQPEENSEVTIPQGEGEVEEQSKDASVSKKPNLEKVAPIQEQQKVNSLPQEKNSEVASSQEYTPVEIDLTTDLQRNYIASSSENQQSVISTTELEDVVVTGYAVQQKQTYTGAARTVNAEQQQYTGRTIIDANAKPLVQDNHQNGDISQALNGKVSGITVQDHTSQPSVTIRGYSSLKKNTQPLYVVDGVVYAAEVSQTISPEKIESVNVLKGENATALYGSKASNGVVVINTKNLTPKEKRELKRVNKKAKKLSKTKDGQPIIEPQVLNVSQEEYESFVENQFESPKNAPLSTFSVDVDRASYSNIRRFINQGQPVTKDAVRIEEMVNYFDYEYEQPKSKDPIAIHTEYSDAPWNENHTLLKIGIQGKEIQKDKLPPSNIVFLIDVSGSMSDANKLPLLKSSIELLVEELSEEDKVSIVVYAGAAGIVLEPTNKKEKILEALNKLTAGGSTAGGEGIELAYKTAEAHFIKRGNNRVILATDGDFNVGASSNDAMEQLIEEKRKTGIFLTCLGYGMGNYKDSKLETLANKGNGNYAYIDNLQEANKVLVKEFSGTMFTIAKDVKVQIEFNPKHVKSYRLIGYENRKLRPEDFTNDAIDAGEMGAGHTVTALYEIIPVGVESEYSQEGPDLKYSETNLENNQFSDELGTVKFRYKQPDGDTSKELVHVIAKNKKSLSRASTDFKFASAVAWFGLKLRDSDLVSNKDSEAILKLAKQGKGKDEEGYRGEMIRLVGLVK